MWAADTHAQCMEFALGAGACCSCAAWHPGRPHLAVGPCFPLHPASRIMQDLQQIGQSARVRAVPEMGGIPSSEVSVLHTNSVSLLTAL